MKAPKTPWRCLRAQAMVPLWDMLNHVTGRCNVRLHHQEGSGDGGGALQMISTAAVPAGGVAPVLLDLPPPPSPPASPPSCLR